MAKRLKRKNIDFYSAFYKKPALDKTQLKKNAVIVAPVAILMICLLITGIMYCDTFYKTAKAQEINASLEDVNIQEAVETAQKLESDIEATQSKKTYLTEMNQIIASYPTFTSETFSKIFATASGGTTYNTIAYDAGSGILTISAQAPEMDYAAKSAAALRAMGVFSGIQYQGYTSGADEVYIFEISCIMKGGESE